jgi:hypothetical protein
MKKNNVDSVNAVQMIECSHKSYVLYEFHVPPDHLLLDRSPNIGPLLSPWELEKFENCRNKSFRTSKILKLLYQQFSNLIISQRDMSGPRLGTLSNNRWSGVSYSLILIWALFICAWLLVWQVDAKSTNGHQYQYRLRSVGRSRSIL